MAKARDQLQDLILTIARKMLQDTGVVPVALASEQVYKKLKPAFRSGFAAAGRIAVYEGTRQRLGAFVRANNAAAEASNGDDLFVGVLPGYNRLQKAYSIKRGGVDCIVAIHKLTFEETNGKIRELQRLADGAQEHARELRRFRDTNWPQLMAAE